MRELFHFDIETVGEHKDFKTFMENDERGANLFLNKFEKMSHWQEKYDNVEEAYLDNAGVISTYGKIVCISCGYLDKEVEKIESCSGDEKYILEKFNNTLKKVEKKDFNLSGFRIVHFDIPWVLHKMHKYDIIPADIIYSYNKKPWEMRITDLSEDWKGRFAWSFSFDELCYELGIKSPKDNLNGSQVHKTYWERGDEDIIKYCESDVSASIKAGEIIYKKER